MSVRFVNTTTSIPVDKKLFKLFLKTVHPEFGRAVESKIRHLDQESFDVFFVDAKDLDLERDNKRDREIDGKDGGMDLVGVYVPPHQGSPRPVIKVSPEKVMDWCVTFKGDSGVTLPLLHLYPVFLVGVVVHELAHLIMDDLPRSDILPWEWLAKTLEEYPRDDFLPRFYHDASRPPPSVRRMRHFVEESLANAFVLRQRVKGKALAALKLAMETQPEGYTHGLLWSGSLTATLEAAWGWGRFKKKLARPRLSFVSSETYISVEKLVGHLRANNSSFPANGSADGFDELQKRLAEIAVAKAGDQPALSSELERLANVPKLRSKDRSEIIRHLSDLGIGEYSIRNDGVVDVQQKTPIHLSFIKYEELPFKFGVVAGDFRISKSRNLKSLKGCPDVVEGDFTCDHNYRLENLQFFPKKIYGCVSVVFCDQIKSLEGVPREIARDFNCSSNSSLASLNGLPDRIGGVLNIKSTPKLRGYLGVFFAEEISRILTSNRDVEKILNRTYADDSNLAECQECLIEAGFEEHAEF